MLKLPSSITLDDASRSAHVLRVAARGTEPDSEVVADAGELKAFDSSALAVLLDCRREALRAGKTFAVRSMPPKLRQLAGLYGVAELLPVAS